MNPKRLKCASVSLQKLRVVEAVTLSAFESGKDFKFLKSNWSTNISFYIYYIIIIIGLHEKKKHNTLKKNNNTNR